MTSRPTSTATATRRAAPATPSGVASDSPRGSIGAIAVYAVPLLSALAACALFWTQERRVAGAWGFPLDDAWIHSTIARNIAQGHGWSYNPGVPVQNSSGPLWTALLALGFKLFGAQVWVLKLMGAACLAGTVALVAHVARRLGLDRVTSAGCALAAALCGTLVWHGLSGMETILAALLVLASLDTFYGWRAGPRRFAWVVFACLAAMARPEALALTPLLLAERFWLSRVARTQAAPAFLRHDVLPAALVALVVLAPYFALNLKLAGTLFPTTFIAKVGDSGLLRALRTGDPREMLVSLTLYPYIWGVHLVAFLAKLNVALFLLAGLGAWALVRGPRRTLAPALVLIALPVLRGVMAPHQIPETQYGRYVGYLLPLFLLLGVAGAAALVHDAARLRAALASRAARRVLFVLLGLVLVSLLRLELRVPHIGTGGLATLPALVPGGVGSPKLDAALQTERLGLLVTALATLFALALGAVPARAGRALGMGLAAAALFLQAVGTWLMAPTYAGNVQNIQSMDVELGRWVQTQVPPGMTVAVNDIGAIAYFGGHPIVDVIGLATPELAHFTYPRKMQMLIRMRRLRPALCIIFPSWFEDWTETPSLLQPVLRHRIEHNSILGSPLTVVYRADWDRFDRYYNDALLEQLDPPFPHATLAQCWRRGLWNLGVRTRSELCTRAGDLLRDAGDARGAETQYRQSIALDPRESAAYDELLKLAAARRDAAAYGAVLQERVRNQPNSAEAFEKLGDWYQVDRHDPEMLRAYETALELRPDRIRVLSKLDAYWTAHGDSARASTYRARLADLQPAVR